MPQPPRTSLSKAYFGAGTRPVLGLGLIALAAIAVVAASERIGIRETGARDWRAALDKRNKLAADQAKRAAARAKRAGKPRELPRRRARSDVDCCAASSDHWKTARDVYDRWKAPSSTSWREAYDQCWRESVEASAAGDYSKPASRRCVLGKMHAAKLAQWKACRADCRRAGLGDDPLLEALGEASSFERYLADDGTGATIWMLAASNDLARVVPEGGDAWRVDYQSEGRGPWRRADTFSTEEDADEHARVLLEAPF